MKPKKLVLILALIAVLIPVSVVIGSEEEPAESMVLQGGGMGNVPFPHGRHQNIDVDCRPCHEMFAKKAQSIDTLKGDGTLKKKDVMSMCKGCHKELTSKDQKAGPVKCNGCHKKG